MLAAITIRMDSDAFHQTPGSELCRILRLLALRIEAEAPTTLTLRDSDGTDVGVFCLDTDWGRS
jgi:phage protein U